MHVSDNKTIEHGVLDAWDAKENAKEWLIFATNAAVALTPLYLWPSWRGVVCFAAGYTAGIIRIGIFARRVRNFKKLKKDSSFFLLNSRQAGRFEKAVHAWNKAKDICARRSMKVPLMGGVKNLEYSNRKLRGEASLSDKDGAILFDQMLWHQKTYIVDYVVGHEIGHVKHGDVRRSMRLGALSYGVTAWVLGYLTPTVQSSLQDFQLFAAAGIGAVTGTAVAVGFGIFNSASAAMCSRIHEWRADLFAAREDGVAITHKAIADKLIAPEFPLENARQVITSSSRLYDMKRTFYYPNGYERVLYMADVAQAIKKRMALAGASPA